MTEVQKLADRLFGPSGMGAKNFRFDAVLGATPEGIAHSINLALDALERGEGEEVDLGEDQQDEHFREVFANARGTISPDVDLE